MLDIAADACGKLSLAVQSITLLFSKSSAAAWLGATVASKYSEPTEIEEHRCQALAGPTPGQIRFLETHLEPGGSVVDIGCAAGRYCFALDSRGYRVAGVDLSERMVGEAVALARARDSTIPFSVMNAQALALHDESFDAVLMLGSVLSHVPLRRARLATLREARRVLKPGGTLLIETQSRASARRYRAFFRMMAWLRRALEGLGQRPVWEVGDRFGMEVSAAGRGQRVYFHMYAPDELERDLRETGFEPRPIERAIYLMRYVATKR